MKYFVALQDINSKEDFHERIAQQLPCPPDYGRNLDALYDVLRGRSVACEVYFWGMDHFSHGMPGYGAALRELCKEAMEENPHLIIRYD